VTLLVLVVLAIIWIAVLVPPALRARAEGRPGDSISAFRRQLVVLRRTRPHVQRAMIPERPAGHAYVARPGVPVTSLTARRAVAARRSAPAGARALATAGLPSTRSRTLRRRRDVLVGLLAAVVGTLVLGVLLGSRALLLAQLVADVLLVAYVALLIRQRTLAAEREMKVRFLPEARPMEPAFLRRSVN
jgi:hypothetical protein